MAIALPPELSSVVGSGLIEARQKARKAAGAAKAAEPPCERLQGLREAMVARNLDAYIIPSEDPHQSEYSAECFARRAFVSRFTGSAGTAVVTADKAALWTDGRYFAQAEKQLRKEWQLMRGGQPGVPSHAEWLADSLPERSRVGIDPFLFSHDAAQELRDALAPKDCTLVPLYEQNLVDVAWGAARPPPPSAPLRVHPLKYAGTGVGDKLARVRGELEEAGATGLVVAVLDEIAWLLNLRGGDVPHCPVAIAYAVVGLQSATLFVDDAKLTPEVTRHLAEAQVAVRPYGDLLQYITSAAAAGERLWMDPAKLSTAVVTAFDDACSALYQRAGDGGPPAKQGKGGKGEKKKAKGPAKDKEKEPKAAGQEGGKGGGAGGGAPACVLRPSPVATWKAQKNAAEMEGMRQAHLRDGAALAEFWAWLEGEVAGPGREVSEVEVAEALEGFRRKQEGFLETSFSTIAGSGPNGAIIHYSAEPGTCGRVGAAQMFLLDSGGQYADGTTDVTRTVHLGAPSAYERACFTHVLRGHVALDRAVFPANTPGFVLDVLARTALWELGLDYRHGTGHGVGAALNVHEGPQGISPRFHNHTGLVPGMVVSNEPGYYEDGAFGIRIENLLAIVEVPTPNRFGGNTFLGFERLTYVPIQANLVDTSLLSEAELSWLNHYHREVWEKISPRVTGQALEWLQKNTRPLAAEGPKEQSATGSWRPEGAASLAS